MGLAGGVADHGGPGRERRGHQGVLGRHHRGLVHEDLAGLEAAGRGEDDVAVGLDRRAHGAEGVEVGIQAPAADDVPAGRWHLGAAEAGEQRPGEQERGADALGELAVDLGGANVGGAQRHLVLGARHPDADVLEQAEHRVDVANARDVRDHDLLLGQHRGREDGQRSVLVPCWDDRA